jgi:ATP-dependent Clp protease ATP-binding subunit ClpX
MHPLTPEILRSILTEPKNAIIRQYKSLFAMDGIQLEVEPEALDFVVAKAVEFQLGARGLRSICETIMVDAMYDLPSQGAEEFRVTREYAEKKLNKANFS